MVKILLIQPLPATRFEDPDNLRRALALLEDCRGWGADLICFPEYFPFAGERQLADAARSLDAYLVAGLVEETSGQRFNTATLFDRRGNLAGRQRKHLVGRLEVRGFGINPGDGGWTALDTDFGRLGLAVCIDFWGQPEAARQLAAQGVDLVVNPAIFPLLRGHWRTGALTRAFDHYLPVVGINTAGFIAEIAGRSYPMQGGRSFVIQPPGFADAQALVARVRQWDSLDDWVLKEAGEREEMVPASLDISTLRHWRRVIQERFGMTPSPSVQAPP